MFCKDAIYRVFSCGNKKSPMNDVIGEGTNDHLIFLYTTVMATPTSKILRVSKELTDADD
jgi:hypothetical protein